MPKVKNFFRMLYTSMKEVEMDNDKLMRKMNIQSYDSPFSLLKYNAMICSNYMFDFRETSYDPNMIVMAGLGIPVKYGLWEGYRPPITLSLDRPEGLDGACATINNVMARQGIINAMLRTAKTRFIENGSLLMLRACTGCTRNIPGYCCFTELVFSVEKLNGIHLGLTRYGYLLVEGKGRKRLVERQVEMKAFALKNLVEDDVTTDDITDAVWMAISHDADNWSKRYSRGREVTLLLDKESVGRSINFMLSMNNLYFIRSVLSFRKRAIEALRYYPSSLSENKPR